MSLVIYLYLIYYKNPCVLHVVRCPVQELQATLPVGAVVGNRYIVEELLGKGGFGAVYLVRDQRVRGNLFALKEVIDADKKERVRFTFEGEVLKRLDHPALPRVYRVFDDEKHSRAYMLMDYIAGPNLETLRQQQPERRFSLTKALSMMAPIFEAVTFLHQQTPPIIHRDIKPANIIVPTAEDSSVLVDFGIAKEYDPDSTTTAIRRCSPGYGAPEQYSMGTNTRTDIYGLGATLYALLTGDIPEDAFYRMTQMSNSSGDPLEPVKHIVPSIPLAVSQAIERAMAINSNERFASVQEFWQALNAYQAQRDTPIPAAAPISHYATTTPNTPRPPVYEQVNRPQVNVVPVPVPMGNPPSIGDSRETTRKRRRVLPLILLALAILLFAGSAAAVGFLFSSSGHKSALAPTPVATHHSSVAPTPTAKATAKPTAKPTAQPTTAPTATPAPPSATATPIPPTPPPAPVYPQVAGVHSGTVTNNNNNLTANMTVTLQQSQSLISGNVAIYSPLSGSGQITSGYVTTGNYIQFIIQPSGLAPLYFKGNVQSGGSMSGSYCSLGSNGRCDPNAGGQGVWNTNAVSSGGS
jgi:serine/threonine protein kinase